MRNRFIKFLAEYSVYHTWKSLLFIISISVVAGVLVTRLELSTGYADMMPEGNQKAEAFEFILEEFNNSSNIIIVAEGDEQSLKAFSQYIKPILLEYTEWVDRVDDQIPIDFLKKYGLKLLHPSELEYFSNLFRNPNLIPVLKNMNDNFENELIGNLEIDSQYSEKLAVHFLDGIEKFIEIQKNILLSGYRKEYAREAVNALTIGESDMLNMDKTMILIMVEPKFNMIDDFKVVVDAVNGIDELVTETAGKFEIQAGLTGSQVLGRDEMRALEEDSMTITLIALAGIFLLFVISFRMWVSPLLAIITVSLGVLWALGMAGILVDSLSMMTSMMGVILVGLGIDYSIHIISTFTEFRSTGLKTFSAMETALLKCGPGIMTGGFTTGTAFLAMMISDNKGMWEMGLVAGCGIVVTMIATLIILPTLLVMRERILGKFNCNRKVRDVSYKSLGIIAETIGKQKKPAIVVLSVITGVLLWNGMNISMDYNYLNLEPVGLKSIELQEKMIEAFDLSSDYILFTVSDIDSARILTEKARQMETAGRVESITDYIPRPEDESGQFHFVRNLRRSILDVSIKKNLTKNDIKNYIDEIQRLELNIIEFQGLAYLGNLDKVYEKSIHLVGEIDDSIKIGILTQLSELIETEDIRYPITKFQQEFAGEFKSELLEMANYEPLRLDNLPEEIKNRFIGNSGNVFLITVYPKQNIWEDANFLYQFTNEAEELSPAATGLPPIFVELMDIIVADGKKSTWIALLVIFLILLLDFRRIKYALYGMVPLVFGILWMVGIMSIFNLQLNMVNIMAIPLIIGIGIDDGVHILHRYKIEKNIHTVYRSTGKAVLLSSLTTMLGFGSLWFATYRGLGSMGIALFIGVGACFLSTLFILPVLLGKSKK